MSTIQKISDALPGGESRAAGRMEIEQANRQKKQASANAKATKETNRPVRTKVFGFLGASLLVGTVFFLSRNDGGEAIGEAVSESAKTGVNVVAGVGSVGVDVATGVISGTKEGVSEIQEETNISLDNPLTLEDDDNVVSNTVPASTPTADVNGPATYEVVAGDGPASIARLCGATALTFDEKVQYYETVILPLSPSLQDGMPNPGDIAVCE